MPGKRGEMQNDVVDKRTTLTTTYRFRGCSKNASTGAKWVKLGGGVNGQGKQCNEFIKTFAIPAITITPADPARFFQNE